MGILDLRINTKHDLASTVNRDSPAGLLKIFLYTAGFNTVIAILLTLARPGHSFWHILLFSQCIGLTICICVKSVWRIFEKKRMLIRAIMFLMALLCGAVGGTLIASVAIGLPEKVYTLANLLPVVVFSMLLGLIITYFFSSRQRLAESIQLAQEERLKRLSSEKQALEADLKRLQAQIEPHFLFNTLSNIVSLIDTDAAKARTMLIDLIQYLRIALSRARETETTLGKEIELVRGYLEIFKIRMGDRLSYRIDVPETLRGEPLMPMLMQPIVENALLHGLEPKIEGGAIAISARQAGDRMTIEISDSGIGLAAHQRPGLGLTNIKERLAQLYGEGARLILTENQPCGVRVIMEMPLHQESK